MPLPVPRKGESQDSFVSRCMSFLDREGSSLTREQRIAACFDTWRRAKKLAGCYNNFTECQHDQINKGKSKEAAEQIATYFQSKVDGEKAIISNSNLIMIHPEMDIGLLPLEHLKYYGTLLPRWERDKIVGRSTLNEFTLEQIEWMKYNVEEELIDKDPKAKVRQRGDVVFPAGSSLVTDDKDHFPINNIAQARNSLARAGQYTSSPPWFKGSLDDLKAKIRSAVKRKYPSIDIAE